MADRTLEQVIAELVGKSKGVLTPVQVNADDPKLAPYWQGASPLDEQSALSVIKQNLTTSTKTQEVSEIEAKTLRFILYSVPRAAWSQKLLSSLDMRPFIESLQRFAETGGQFPSKYHPSEIGWDSVEEPVSKDVVAKWKATADQLAQDVVNRTKTSTTDTGTPQPYTSGTAGISPTAAYTNDTANQTDPQTGLGINRNQTPTMSRDEIVSSLLISNNPDDIRQVLDIVSAKEKAGVVTPNLNIDMGAPRPSTQPAFYGTGHGGSRMTLVEAANYLSGTDVTPQMVANMQDKLIHAGYLDQAQGTVVRGDNRDPLTIAAWRKALADSFTTNTPLPALLLQRGQERVARMPAMQGPLHEQALNQAAQALIGRNLDTEEIGMVTKMLSQLRENKGFNSAGNNQFGYNEGDVASTISAEFKDETGYMHVGQAAYRIQNALQNWYKDTN